MLLGEILIGLPILGILIFFHEAGHFLVARACGINVEVFSLGMGPRIWGFERQGTDYRISAVPLGGYCRMKGEQDMSNALEKKQDRIDPSPGSYYAASPFKRILVVLAGPAMNLLLALVIMAGINLAGYEYDSSPSRIILYSEVNPEHTAYPADKAGLKTGDTITAIQGQPIQNYTELYSSIGKNALQDLTVRIERNGQILDLHITPELQKDTGAGRMGVLPWRECRVGKPGTGKTLPLGLETGDLILGINGKAARNTVELESLAASLPEPHTYQIQRGSEVLTLVLQPRYLPDGNTLPDIPFAAQTYRSPRLGLGSAIAKGWTDCIDTLILAVRSLGLLFQGLNPQSAVSGPLRISHMVGESTVQSFSAGFGQGMHNLLQFVALISIALFFGNLLPIPALDGGQFVLFIIEIFARKPLSPKLIQNYQVVGVVLVLGLTAFAFYGDIVYFIQKLFPG